MNPGAQPRAPVAARARRGLDADANGYSGELIAREAATQGLGPILAGRRAEQIEPLARELGLEHRVFNLIAPERAIAGLEGVGLVLHVPGAT